MNGFLDSFVNDTHANVPHIGPACNPIKTSSTDAAAAAAMSNPKLVPTECTLLEADTRLTTFLADPSHRHVHYLL